MTTPVSNISRTNIGLLDPNLTIGLAASPSLQKNVFDEIYNYFDTFVTAYNAFIAAGGIATGNLADLSVTTAKLALLSITAAQIANATITASQIADGAVTSAKILDGTISTADLADTIITTAKLALLSVTTAQLADSSVTSAKIVDGTIATADIADSAITSLKIADGTIVNADINASAAIDGSKLANLSITSAQIADGTIMDVDINTSAAIDAAKIGAGLVSNAEFGYLDGVTGPIQTQLTNATLGAIADGSITDVKLDNGGTSVKAKANAAAPKANPSFTGLVKSTNNTLDDGTGRVLINIGSQSGNGAQILTSGSEAALSLKNTGVSGREYLIGSGSGTSGFGVGNFGVYDLSSGGGLRFSIDPSGNTTFAGALTAGAGGSFASSLTSAGYQKLPGGMIMQWSNITIAASGTDTVVTLPIPFPTDNAYNVSLTVTGSVALSNILTVSSWGKSSFTVKNNGVSCSAFFLAIGH